MIARVIDGVWRENLESARRLWARATRSEGRAENSLQQLSPRERGATAKRLHRKIVGGTVAVIGVLALTYSAASALVSGAANSGAARSDYMTVLQAASAQYRLARAECLERPFDRRDACVAEAHADEAKMRNAASSAPRKQLSQLRHKSDQLLLAAAGQDSIVIEPACNVVARGSASVCEIQVRGTTPDGPDLASMRRPQADISAQPVASTSRHASLSRWFSGPVPEREHYFANVAAVIAP